MKHKNHAFSNQLKKRTTIYFIKQYVAKQLLSKAEVLNQNIVRPIDLL